MSEFEISLKKLKEYSHNDVFVSMHDMLNINDYIQKKIQPRQCDCGAKHTSFSNHHYYWCSVKENK